MIDDDRRTRRRDNLTLENRLFRDTSNETAIVFS